MDENKDFEEKAEEIAEEIEEQVKEAAEEVADFVEETTEKAEEVVEDAAEAVEEFAEDAQEAVEEAVSDVTEGVSEFAEEVFAAPKKSKAPIIAIIAAAVILIALCVLTFMGKFPMIYNKYNHMGYVNITGKTIGEIAEESGMELSEFLEQYGLPADMPGNTNETAARYLVPLKTIVSTYEQMYGIGFEDIKELLGLGDEITEDTPWGEAEGEVTLENRIGEENLESFKEKYGFGDEVTLETKWKEVRDVVDKAAKREYEEQEEEVEETSAETEEPVEEETEDAE